MLRYLWLLIGCALAPNAFAVNSASNTSPDAAIDRPALAGATAQPSRHVLQHDGVERSYYLVTPQRIENQPLAAVIVLHGGGGNARSIMRATGFAEMALAERFIAVFPEGTGRLPNVLTWNARHCCGYAMQKHVDDVGFIATLIDTLVREHGADPARVYVTGMSNGGLMAHQLGYRLPDRIAAIAPVAGGLFGDETALEYSTPGNTVSALIINGALDTSVPPAGGRSGGRFPAAWDGHTLAPAGRQATFWAQAAGCEPHPITVTSNDSVLTQFSCPPGVSVSAYLLTSHRHEWPGGARGSIPGQRPSAGTNATKLIWAFFKAHPKWAVGPRARRPEP